MKIEQRETNSFLKATVYFSISNNEFSVTMNVTITQRTDGNILSVRIVGFEVG